MVAVKFHALQRRALGAEAESAAGLARGGGFGLLVIQQHIVAAEFAAGRPAAVHEVARLDGRDSLTEIEAKQVFAAYGLQTTRTKLAKTEAEAEEPIATSLKIDDLKVELGYALLPLVALAAEAMKTLFARQREAIERARP